jgi:hypothetical protein
MLPKIDVPIYNVKLLSNGKNLRFRPFTVKEEKLFLMANEGEDLTTVVDTIKQILNNCILDEFVPQMQENTVGASWRKARAREYQANNYR